MDDVSKQEGLDNEPRRGLLVPLVLKLYAGDMLVAAELVREDMYG